MGGSRTVTEPCCKAAPAPPMGHRTPGMANAAVRLLLATPPGFSLAALLQGLILSQKAAAQSWGNSSVLLPNTIPTMVNKVQGRELKKTPKKTLLAAAESSDSSRRQPPLLHGMQASSSEPCMHPQNSGVLSPGEDKDSHDTQEKNSPKLPCFMF